MINAYLLLQEAKQRLRQFILSMASEMWITVQIILAHIQNCNFYFADNYP